MYTTIVVDWDQVFEDAATMNLYNIISNVEDHLDREKFETLIQIDEPEVDRTLLGNCVEHVMLTSGESWSTRFYQVQDLLKFVSDNAKYVK